MTRATRPAGLVPSLAWLLTLAACSSNSGSGCPVASSSCPCLGTCVAPSYVFMSAPVTLAWYPVTSSGMLSTPTNLSGSALSSLRIAAAPLSPYLYQPDIVSRSVLAYVIGTSTGALTSVMGSPFSMGSGSLGAVDVAITPDGSKLSCF